uniref:Uncharacterized protein n=1 Tax=Ascaris lumbricoides TaxID=6252 RepID=A0A0M3I2B0_ASCLU
MTSFFLQALHTVRSLGNVCSLMGLLLRMLQGSILVHFHFFDI